MKPLAALASALAALLLTGTLPAQTPVPILLNYQGRVVVGTVNFNSPPDGLFKFALVDAAGTTAYWSNDGTLIGPITPTSQPTAAVALTVTKGLCSAMLGDTTLANMTAIPASVFANADVRLRVWFNDGTNGSQLLTPDQRIAPSAYLSDGAVTSAKIANSAITSAKIAAGAVNGTHVAPASLNFGHLTVPIAPGPGQVLGFDGTGLNWTAPGGGVFALNGTSAYYNGGNVGIGAMNPGNFKLRVVGNTRLGQTMTIGRSGFHYDEIGYNVGFTGTNDTYTRLLPDTAASIRLGYNGGIEFRTAPFGDMDLPLVLTNRIVIRANGNVGINTTNPNNTLEISSNSGGLRLSYASEPSTYFLEINPIVTSGVVRYSFNQRNSNTDYPNTLVFALGNVGIGTATPEARLEVVGNVKVSGAGNSLSTPALLITGGADVAEPFSVSHPIKPKPGMVMSIDREHPGELCVATSAYARTVAGIISGANGLNPGLTLRQPGTAADGTYPVALSGRVYCWCDAAYGEIHPGDLLTTSNTPGHAMVATDFTRAPGATIGKAMTALANGTGLVLVLVTLQ